jgi:hypothetical protein
MPPPYSFEVIIRKQKYTAAEELYRVTIFKKIDGIDDLLVHPEVMSIVGNKVVRSEKIDNFRYNIYVSK